MIHQTAASLLKTLEDGDATAVEVTQSFLDRIDTHDSQVGAFLTVNKDAALESANDIDRRRKAGQPIGKLAGLPVAIKDVLCTDGQKTTCGSQMLAEFVPPYDATVIQQLKAADAVLIGKTNMDEFAMGSSTENSALGTDAKSMGCGTCTGRLERWRGGLRRGIHGPAFHWHGHGRVNTAACRVLWRCRLEANLRSCQSLWLGGVREQSGSGRSALATTAEDAALLLDVIGGHDPRDSTSVPIKLSRIFFRSQQQPLAGVQTRCRQRSLWRRIGYRGGIGRARGDPSL